MATTATKDGRVNFWQGRKSRTWKMPGAVTDVQFAPAYRFLLDAPGLLPNCLRQRRNTFGGFIGCYCSFNGLVHKCHYPKM